MELPESESVPDGILSCESTPEKIGNENVGSSQEEESVNNDYKSELSEDGNSKIETQEVEKQEKHFEELRQRDLDVQRLNGTIAGFEQKCFQLEHICRELSEKLEVTQKQKELAIKEKESMVIKYAMGEKTILNEKRAKEQTEKKLKEVNHENDILQHKVQTMVSEKARICQMLDNKCYEFKSLQQENDRIKSDLSSLETKLKWSQNSLKNEIENHKDTQSNVENLQKRLHDVTSQIDQIKSDAQESIKTFHNSQENRANILDVQVKEQQASLILLRHEKDDREQQIKNLRAELERLQKKQSEMLLENNELSLKVQNLEKERLDMGNKLSELRGCADQQRQDVADLQTKSAQLEQLKLQLKNEQDQLQACNEQKNLLRLRNSDLESDMEACRSREADLLIFTQQLTDKNVRLQSEFTSMETKVQQLTCEQSLLKRASKEHETKSSMAAIQLSEARLRYAEEMEALKTELAEKTTLNHKLKQDILDQQGENVVIKRKLEFSLREVQKELQHCRKKLERYETLGSNNNSSSSTSSNVSLNGTSCDKRSDSPCDEHVKVIQPDILIDRQALIEHIVKLQRISAKKSEKLDFLEEHVHTLLAELQKKSRLLQSYVLREQTGTLTSNKMDNNKADIAKLKGVMASMYNSKVVDDNLTLELSLDINRKLQAVLEDALLKNITLKENVDTLGAEIDRLNQLVKT